MTLNEIHKAIGKIGALAVTTLDGDTMHSRIISICGGDEEGLYFLTMSVKPFYRQLKANPQVALCGICPSGRKTGKNAAGQPTWEPGYTVNRATPEWYHGDIRNRPNDADLDRVESMVNRLLQKNCAISSETGVPANQFIAQSKQTNMLPG